MATIRRLYLYLMSGISLGVLLAGVVLLLTVLFDRLGILAGDASLFGGEEWVRQQLTLGAALSVVALPVWLIHWTLAERPVRPGAPDADAERSAALRGLYIAAVLAILLAFAASAFGDLIRIIIVSTTASGGADGASSELANASEPLARLLVLGAAWGYHLAIRLRDWRRGPIVDAGAWLPRLYLYGAVLIGLLVLLSSLASLVELAARAAAGANEELFGGPGRWWSYPLASAVSGIGGGALVWGGHWWYASRLVADVGHRGAEERPARLRLAYFVVALVILGGFALGELVQLVQTLVGAAAGSRSGFVVEPLAVQVARPAADVVLFTAAWLMHRRWLATDTALVPLPGRPAMVDRLDASAHGMLGLVFAAFGAAWLIGIVIETVFSAGPVLLGDAFVDQQLGAATTALIGGSAFWLWGWGRMRRRAALDPRGEAESPVRRAAVLLAVAGSVLAALGGTAFLLYRFFGALFGLTLGGNLAADLSRPIGVVLVAAAVGAYYGIALRRDQAIRATAAPAPPAVAAPPGASAPAGEVPAVVVELRLSGASQDRLLAAVSALRRDLGGEASVEVLRFTETPQPAAGPSPGNEPVDPTIAVDAPPTDPLER